MQIAGSVAKEGLADLLKDVSTKTIAEVLAARPDLSSILRPDGLIPPECYALRTQLGPLLTVDIGIVRFDSKKGKYVGGAIIRNTGKASGKNVLAGGIVARFETIPDAIRRHCKRDLNLDVELPLGDWPIATHNYAPFTEDGKHRPGFGQEFDKHSAGADFVVTCKDYSTMHFGEKIGGVEARKFVEYSLDDCPPDEEWGYDMGPQFRKIMSRVGRLSDAGILEI